MAFAMILFNVLLMNHFHNLWAFISLLEWYWWWIYTYINIYFLSDFDPRKLQPLHSKLLHFCDPIFGFGFSLP